MRPFMKESHRAARTSPCEPVVQSCNRESPSSVLNKLFGLEVPAAEES